MEEIQLVMRLRPRPLLYARNKPITTTIPTPAQAECRLRFGEISRMSRHYSAEEVARMVGGEVVEINGRKYIRMPDGRILMKHHALIKHMLSGWRSEKTRIPRTPQWLETLSRKYYPPAPEAIKVIKEIVGK